MSATGLWQLLDSAFPAGGFAHSGALESLAQSGELTGASLPTFLRTSLRLQTRSLLPFLLQAHRDLEAFQNINLSCDAFLINHVARAASSRQGRSLLSSAAAIFHDARLSALNDTFHLRGALKDHAPCHYAPAHGTVAASLGLSRGEAAQSYLFVTLRDQVLSAIRLGIVGPMEGHAILYSLRSEIEHLAHEATSGREPEAFQIAPLIDIVQTTHSRLYSRLFQS